MGLDYGLFFLFNLLCLAPYLKYIKTPTASQIINLNQVSPGSENIINRQQTIPNIGIKGTNGVLKALGRSGCVLRKMIIPAHTNTNASKVPILVISPTTVAGTKAANKLTNTMNKRFDLEGVPNLGCTSENTFGSKPSFYIEKNTRDWPISITIITEEYPARIAMIIALFSHG